FVPVSLLGLIWAAAAFVLLDPYLTAPLRRGLLPLLPGQFLPGKYLSHPQLSSGSMRLTDWAGLLLFSLVVPALEELYFRGYLMDRMRSLRHWAPLVSSVLFAVYHVWSPWMIPVRVIAVLPYVWFSYRYRSVWIAITVHTALNLV